MKFNDYLLRGIDVSQFNDIPNAKLPDVKKAVDLGVKFIIYRSGYGQVQDKLFTHFKDSTKGICDRAVYHYLDYYSHTSLGINSSQWGIKQAEFIWKLIKDDPVPVFIDIEKASIAASIETVWGTVVTILDNLLLKLDTLSGKTTGIYCSAGLLPKFHTYHKQRPLFVANYNPVSVERLKKIVADAGWTNLLIWQYASNGDVDGDGLGDGIRYGMEYKYLDLDIWLADPLKYKEFFGVKPTVEDVPLELKLEQKVDILWAKYLTENHT
jgi:GH25 family lysozyme M1 (1,4-beta-N-acetylmuramidase)